MTDSADTIKTAEEFAAFKAEYDAALSVAPKMPRLQDRLSEGYIAAYVAWRDYRIAIIQPMLDRAAASYTALTGLKINTTYANPVGALEGLFEDYSYIPYYYD